MSEPISTYKLSDNKRLCVYQDEDLESPRVWGNIGKLCIRKHRSYDFPNELDIDFDRQDEYEEMNQINPLIQLAKGYYIFDLDCYEHGWIKFSFSGSGMQCNFDKSNNVGILAIPKELEGAVYTEEQAKEIAKEELKEYNQYLNGEVYGYVVEEQNVWTNEKGDTKTERNSNDDSCWGFYDIANILQEFKVTDADKIL